jgi:predicted GNAT family acetyltransferase
MAVTVRNDPQEQRYVALVDGEPAGFAAYRHHAGLIAFTHTEVDPRFEGRGVGSALARAALDEARANGDAVLPFCPFVNRWISEHAEYRDLVPEDRRAVFSL